jgi:hypothetical protein
MPSVLVPFVVDTRDFILIQLLSSLRLCGALWLNDRLALAVLFFIG